MTYILLFCYIYEVLLIQNINYIYRNYMHRIEYKYAQIYLVHMIFDTFCSWKLQCGVEKKTPKNTYLLYAPNWIYNYACIYLIYGMYMILIVWTQVWGKKRHPIINISCGAHYNRHVNFKPYSPRKIFKKLIICLIIYQLFFDI